jgi:hypothetical protein
VIHGRQLTVELDQLQRKAHAARRALKTVQSEGRAALQLVAQLDDEITALRTQLHPQPEEAQTHDTDHARTPAVLA